MPDIEIKLESFYNTMKDKMKGIDNAKSCTELTLITMEQMGLKVNNVLARDPNFTTMKRTHYNYLLELVKRRKIKRKKRPSPFSMDEYIYWID